MSHPAAGTGAEPASESAAESAQAPTSGSPPRKVTIATAWLDGCSGCHMSFLDMDERLIALADCIDMVYSPLVDSKTLPDQVDVGILEGSISNEEDLHKAREFRQRCTLLVSLGDCAVNGNVPAMRNPFKLDAVIERAYRDNVEVNPQIPTEGVPRLLPVVQPIHGVVKVDIFVPGCPPRADAIHYVLSELIAGRTPDPSQVTRFGA
ncbi:NADP oxidoreductase [Thiohalocapsa marina]|uniref:NADP oxidoreductase n=2 Tax=Thiohalocapsa marina TaxID=424902 RepID=A0A5M8FEA1_9GAMM|nr:NADP oxidoreductase [Thiohalocapsa marina]